MALEETTTREFRVMVDPGHGGKDPGAIGRDPFTVKECDIVWCVSALLRDSLQRVGLKVATTRRQGEYISLGERASRANSWPADCFVSIHCNASTNYRAHGIEVLHYGSPGGKLLAECTLAQLDAEPPSGSTIRIRGLKERPGLAVLRKTKMPACLVELPFVSNPGNLGSLIEPDNQVFWADRIARGVVVWVRSRS